MSLFHLDSDPSKDQQNNEQRSLSQRYSDLNEDVQDKNQGRNVWQLILNQKSWNNQELTKMQN